jgi:hypothetical protein
MQLHVVSCVDSDWVGNESSSRLDAKNPLAGGARWLMKFSSSAFAMALLFW